LRDGLLRGVYHRAALAPTRWLAMTGSLSFGTVCADFVSQCDAWRSRFKLWNESGTNRARIGDSYALLIRSPQHLALTPDGGTRSSLARGDKRGFGGEILKERENAESNQKQQRVKR
jgi:hypothetical protein